VLAPDETRALITQAGLRGVQWLTDQELNAEIARHEVSGEAGPASGGLNAALLNGPDGPSMGANVQRNMEEGRIVWGTGLFERI
jgi:hypothetical protein